MFIYYMTFGVIFVAFILIYHNFVDLRAHGEGTELMIEKAAIIRSGAKTFLRRQDRAIIVVVGVIGLAYMVMYGFTVGLCLWFGSLLSRTAVEIGMRGGTYGNVRTTNAARITGAISRTIRIALLAGIAKNKMSTKFNLNSTATSVISSGNKTKQMIVLKVLKIIGSVILIISAILDIFYVHEVVRKEEVEKYDFFISAGNSYGFCFFLIGIAILLLVTL